MDKTDNKMANFNNHTTRDKEYTTHGTFNLFLALYTIREQLVIRNPGITTKLTGQSKWMIKIIRWNSI
ncbi:MAG TPA: hypothetical protein VN704_08200, partial [Verrucomicrobiae bacterium]|nr:hypothetical protein [Verrucomicrobiae bacterium]